MKTDARRAGDRVPGIEPGDGKYRFYGTCRLGGKYRFGRNIIDEVKKC